ARAPPEHVGAEVLQGVALGIAARLERNGRGHEPTIVLAREVLQPGGRVEDVAVEDDVALAAAHLAHDHRPGMQRTTHARRDAEVADELGGGRSQSLFDAEEAAERAGARPSVGFPPRDADLVADVLVDLAAVVVHGVGGQHEDPIEKMMDARGPEALGQPRGARDIDEQEEAMLLPWAVVPPQHPVAQRPTANDLAELEYEEEG